ncbi:VIT family domain containing protein [Elaphomyces granulatus]|jgi:VIT1/CCC1 family predicted Fe2+/Mn2+ transporter
MFLALIKRFLPRYTLISEETLTVDSEKDSQEMPLRQDQDDLEAAEPLVSSEDFETLEKGKSKLVDPRVISDAIIGLSDGMTVPFALTAGLSTLDNTKVVVFGGLAELIAGAISMGLGGYLGAKSEEESYKATLKETCKQTSSESSDTEAVISDIFTPYELPPPILKDLTAHLSKSPKLPSFLMNFHHTLPEPSGSRAITCAFTIAFGYFAGGFVPLMPYFFVGPHDAFYALRWSIATMTVALFLFGYGKICFLTGWKGSSNIRRGLIGGVQMVFVGGLAAGAAMGLVKAFQSLSSSANN